MEVHIPSPSVFLKKSPTITPAVPVPPKKPAVPKQKSAAGATAAAKPANKVQDGAVVKPKQSKSRNGMCYDISLIDPCATNLSLKPGCGAMI